MAGETSLARQLKKLATPQTNLYVQGKTRKSLLFDHRDAATIDLDDFFNHGITGLEKLSLLYPPFQQFEKDLFHISRKTFERSVQTTEVNEKLDKRLVLFLQMVSPFFLTKAALEALEWLVYRYHIHQFNTDALVGCAIPYFNTGPFVKVLQLLDINDVYNRWNWLVPIQKAETHLEYSVLLNRFNSDAGFRKFVCDIAPASLKVFSDSPSSTLPIVCFSMLTAFSALEKCEITDGHVTFLFPYILKGLESGLEQYQATSFLLITRLVTKVKLLPNLLTKLLVKVFKKTLDNLWKEAFELVAVVFQHQEVDVLSDDLFWLMISKEEFWPQIVYISENYESTQLLSAILKQAISHWLGGEELPSDHYGHLENFMLEGGLDSLTLNEKTVKFMIDEVFGCYLQRPEIAEKNAKNKICWLERKFPEYFDKALSHYFTRYPDHSKRLNKLINESTCSMGNKMVPNQELTLVLGVNHANSSIRCSSIQYLIELVSTGTVSDPSFVRNVLCERLSDDDPQVIVSVLSDPDVFVKCVDMNEALYGFAKILRQTSKKLHWSHLQVFNIMLKYIESNVNCQYELFILLAIHLFPPRKKNVKGYVKILEMHKKHPFPELLDKLDASDSDIKNKNIAELNRTIFSAIIKYVSHLNFSELESFLKVVQEKSPKFESTSLWVIQFYALGHAITLTQILNQKLHYVESLLTILRNLPFRILVEGSSSDDLLEPQNIEKCVSILKKDLFPGIIAFQTIRKILTDLNLDFTEDKCYFKHSQESDEGYLVSAQILKIFLEYFCIVLQTEPNKPMLENNQQLFSLFLQHFKTNNHLYGFLSNLWHEDSELSIQLFSLDTFHNQVSKISANTNWFFSNFKFFCNLLVVISSEFSEKRTLAFNILEQLFKNFKSSVKNSTHSLAEMLLKSKEEIIIDHQQCFTAIANWLNPILKQYKYSASNAQGSDDSTKKKSVLDNFVELLQDSNTSSDMKYQVLLCLQEIDACGVLDAYVPIIESFLERVKDSNADKISRDIFQLLLKKFTANTALCLKDNTSETSVLFECLNLFYKNESAALCVLNIFSKDFFVNISSSSVQRKVLTTLLHIYMSCTTNVNQQVKKVLSKLCVHAYLILRDDQKESPSKGSTLRELKKAKSSSNSSESIDCDFWKKTTILLEIIQSKTKLEKKEILVQELFKLLKKSLDLDSLSSVEYVKQLILASLYNCCECLGSDGLDERLFQVELIIQSIRSSNNPKTHHQALLLLNLAATLFPDYVLTNVMSIFTFMGSNLIRQDDSYSFQVIYQTIETIVPSMLAASSLQKESNVVAAVIRVFVNALLDIPSHRQLPLFTKLLRTLDPSEFLWLPLGQICDQYASMFNLSPESMEKTNIPVPFEFAIHLQREFRPKVQMDSCIRLLDFLTTLPDHKEEKIETSITEPFDVARNSENTLQMYKYNVLSYINLWLSSQAFIGQVSELSQKQQHHLEEKYEILLKMALQYLQHQKTVKPLSNEKDRDLLPHIYTLIGHINSLLPGNLFIKVVRSLLQNSDASIQEKAIELLSMKLEQDRSLFDSHQELLLKLLRPLLKVVNSSETEENHHLDGNCQIALYALHLLTKAIASSNPGKFMKVLNVVVRILKENRNHDLTLNALLCLAQLCISLNVQVLPQLNIFMPLILSLMSENMRENRNESLLLGIMTTLHSLVENVGMFLSSYTQPMIMSVCQLSIRCQASERHVLQEKVKLFRSVLSREMPLRILLAAFENSYEALSDDEPGAVVSLMGMLMDKISACSHDEVMSSALQLETFYLNLLNFRNSHSQLLASSAVVLHTVESSVISALRMFVVKMNVNRLRSFFQSVFLWATLEENDDDLALKVFTFYHLTCELSPTLKHFFITVARFFLKHAASTLDAHNISKDPDIADEHMSRQLVENILDTLNTCFEYDDGRLLDKDYFETLMQPLVDQVDNFYQNKEHYQSFISEHLGTCLGRFMSSVSEHELWKKLNYQILLKTRHESPVVRFAALQVIREVVRQMEDNYLVLLPESIPFLVEIMEDESSEVEKECQIVITDMEKILGEPIRKYF